MKVLVLGSGVIGTSIAYYLARDGHEVSVVDRQEGPALETSFANAGEISPGYSAPWAGPGVPLKAIRWMLMRHSPLIIKPSTDPAMWRWMWAMLRNCTSQRYRVNKSRMLRLAQYSRDCLSELRDATGITYDERTRGTLQLFRTAKQLDGVHQDTEVLKEHGVAYQVLDRQGYLQHEPALELVKEKFVGALRLPGDETGDCFMFTRRLASMARDLGATFKFGRHIEAIEHDGDSVRQVMTDRGALRADAYVVALGSSSTRLLAPLGIRLPVYPVKGFSITTRITNADAAPLSTIMDETHKVAVTRLGDRIRVGGMAQLSGYDLSLDSRRRKTLQFVLGDLFPGSCDTADNEFWTGLRPMTPDGTPILGPSRYANLHVSTGHGTLGWTMAAGTGRFMADLLSGRTPEIDAEGLCLRRYG